MESESLKIANNLAVARQTAALRDDVAPRLFSAQQGWNRAIGGHYTNRAQLQQQVQAVRLDLQAALDALEAIADVDPTKGLHAGMQHLGTVGGAANGTGAQHG